MNIRNEDVAELRMEVTDGHTHLRTTLTLTNGTEITLQEATVAGMVRAYVSIKTHPKTTGIVMKGAKVQGAKKGYADWQLLEAPDPGHKSNKLTGI